MGTIFTIINFIRPNATLRTAAQVATHTSLMLNRTSELLKFAYGEELDGASPMLRNQGQRPFLHQEHDHEQEHQLLMQEEYLDEETDALNKETIYLINIKIIKNLEKKL